MQFEIPRKILCDHCRGSGAASDGDIVQCTTCRGQGMMVQKAQVFPGMYTNVQSTYVGLFLAASLPRFAS
jgi:DnaJ-related protein SCJ1